VGSMIEVMKVCNWKQPKGHCLVKDSDDSDCGLGGEESSMLIVACTQKGVVGE
jgi:hypothetical protein